MLIPENWFEPNSFSVNKKLLNLLSTVVNLNFNTEFFRRIIRSMALILGTCKMICTLHYVGTSMYSHYTEVKVP